MLDAGPRAIARIVVVVCGLCTVIVACDPASQPHHPHGTQPARAAARATTLPAEPAPDLSVALPAPAALTPFALSAPGTGSRSGQGIWRPAGRRVRGSVAVYETALTPPGGTGSGGTGSGGTGSGGTGSGGTAPAGIAWMDTHLLSARLYSGSRSPGGGPYRYTAPIEPSEAASLVAAFNGGFLMKDANGGYYTQGRAIYPLRQGAASLVIYANGTADVGAWGSDVRMTKDVVSVRQNLMPLVAGGQPAPRAATARWHVWGNTCGVTSCAHLVRGVEHQWRSGLGVTSDGALVYVSGPGLDPLQLAQLLVRAGAVRGMQLDINPNWPVFAAYDPPPGGRAAPANGTRLVASSAQGPGTFFEAAWARDFITMSARA